VSTALLAIEGSNETELLNGTKWTKVTKKQRVHATRDAHLHLNEIGLS
jgi:hypothetical protein